MKSKNDVAKRWGLAPNATWEDIQRVYRQQVQRLHPDRVGNTPQAQENFCRLQEEYGLLKDPHTRAQLLAADAEKETPSSPAAPPSASVFSRTTNTYVPSADVHVDVLLPLAAVWEGGQCLMSTTVAYPCTCGRHRACPHCQGTGQVFATQQVGLAFPAGVQHDQTLCVPHAGHRGTLSSGNLYARVRWTHTHGWTWQKDHLRLCVLLPRRRWWSLSKVWIYAPSGALGHFPRPNLMDTDIQVVLPRLGFPSPHGERQKVVVVVRLASLRQTWWVDIQQYGRQCRGWLQYCTAVLQKAIQKMLNKQ